MSEADVQKYLDDVVYDLFALKNKEEYERLRFQPDFLLPDSILQFCNANKIQVDVWEPPFPEDPPIDWAFYFETPEFANNVYSMNYQTYLGISKLAKVYYLNSSFVFNDPDPDAMYVVNEGDKYSGDPATTLERDLWKLLQESLSKKGYRRLEARLADRIVIGLKNLNSYNSDLEELDDPSRANELADEDYLLNYYEVFYVYEYEEIGFTKLYAVKRKYDESLSER